MVSGFQLSSIFQINNFPIPNKRRVVCQLFLGFSWNVFDCVRYHPFYISDSSEGGFSQKKEEARRRQRVFAGVAYDNEGYPYPTAGELLSHFLGF